MIHLLLLALLSFCSANTIKIVELMDSIKSLSLLDSGTDSDSDSDNDLRLELERDFLSLTGIDFHGVKNKNRFYCIISNNHNNENILKPLGLMSFQIMLLVLMFVVYIALVCSILKNLIFFLSNNFGLFVMIYAIGLIVTTIMICVGDMPLIGCFLFNFIMIGIYFTYHNKKILRFSIKYIVNLIWVGAVLANILILVIRDHDTFLKIFETSIFFWGTLVASVCIFIVSDECYNNTNRLFSKYMRPIAVMYYLLLIYFGTIFNIPSYKGIGGTFLVLWILDLERMILCRICNYGTTYLFITLINFYNIKILLDTYPEYFIFN